MVLEFAWPPGGSPIGLGMKTCLSRMDMPCPESRGRNTENSPHTNDSLARKSADEAIWANFGAIFFSKSTQKQKFNHGIKTRLRDPIAVLIIT